MPTIRAALVLTVFLAVTFFLIPFNGCCWSETAARAAPFPIAITALSRICSASRFAWWATRRAQGAALLLANHTSWLDIVIFSAVTPLSFVAKSEVNDWPFFGTLARLQRTVFVTRAKRSETGEARRRHRANGCRQGDVLVLFPEGTSRRRQLVLPFKSALAQRGGYRPCIRAAMSPVQPVSTAYVARQGHPHGAGKPPALRLVWRHGTGAAFVGGAEGRPSGRGGAISSPNWRAWTARNLRAWLGIRVRKGQAAALAGLF